ncbi:MAG: hypothetical protein PHE79_02865 [Eubacteriales bacterium]|nr:hypothetical protein [Eubacteriales bacterium]
MKKGLWIAGTIIACILWSVFIGFISVVVSIVAGIVTRSGSPSNVTGLLLPLMFIGWIALIILSIKTRKQWAIRCHACKKIGALELVKTEVIGKKEISVPVEVAHRNLKREVTGTHEQYVPGKRITYQDTYKCKFCGNIETYIRTKDQADI